MDVIQKVIAANPLNNGGVVSHVSKTGLIKSEAPDLPKNPDPSGVYNKLDTRFDDYGYYSN